jgi:hypothetical protein
MFTKNEVMKFRRSELKYGIYAMMFDEGFDLFNNFKSNYDYKPTVNDYHNILKEAELRLNHFNIHLDLIDNFIDKLDDNTFNFIYSTENLDLNDEEYEEYINDRFSDDDPIKSICCFFKISKYIKKYLVKYLRFNIQLKNDIYDDGDEVVI